MRYANAEEKKKRRKESVVEFLQKLLGQNVPEFFLHCNTLTLTMCADRFMMHLQCYVICGYACSPSTVNNINNITCILKSNIVLTCTSTLTSPAPH